MPLPDDLLRPGIELRETHISWVFLSANEVWKVKKPVELGFLDFSTIEKRREACEAEVRLNRRLAPGVYRGVVPVHRGEAGHLSIDGTGAVIDWAVHMWRLPDRDRADVRLSQGRLTQDHVETIAERVARFHEECDSNDHTARFGALEVIGRNVRENFEQARATILEYVSQEQANEIESWQTEFVDARKALFEARIRERRIRDGHGDLRLEHVYLDEAGEVVIIDCIEFNERFRFADVCADVVFLAMDLARSERVDLAERFVALYAREANDFDLYPLVDFYESYRAFVRGKIAAMIASDPEADAMVREKNREDARTYYLLALASERRALVPPALVVVGGIMASGKSTVASRAAAELAVPMIDADRTRKFLAGVEPTTPIPAKPWQGVYSREFSEKVYEELFRRARAVLTSGRPVILDATFRSAAHRSAARKLAAELGVPFAFVECRATTEVCRERLLRRREEVGVSDGRLAIFDDFVKKWEPVTDLPKEEHFVVDTTKPLEQTMDQLRRRLPVSFAPLTH
ncbi:MAG TPA: AAA family ATPase [Vicinamibacteria bacterium]|nr:AAA family ATPase [Vicinamibacteria bacterium]